MKGKGNPLNSQSTNNYHPITNAPNLTDARIIPHPFQPRFWVQRPLRQIIFHNDRSNHWKTHHLQTLPCISQRPAQCHFRQYIFVINLIRHRKLPQTQRARRHLQNRSMYQTVRWTTSPCCIRVRRAFPRWVHKRKHLSKSDTRIPHKQTAGLHSAAVRGGQYHKINVRNRHRPRLT